MEGSSTASTSKSKPRSKTRRRYNTVHDLAALRLHPDGSRVATEPTSVKAKTLLYARSLRHAGLDAQGNWIARDAAGLGRVKRRRTTPREDKSDAEEEPEEPEEDKGEGSSRSPPAKRLKTARAKRRQEFLHKLQNVQDEVLDGKPADDVDASDEESTFPVPSADLLKCIHHFASHYYAAEGVLLDKTRDYREGKKERRVKKDKEIGDLFADGEDNGEDGEGDRRANDSREDKGSEEDEELDFQEEDPSMLEGDEEDEYEDEFGIVYSGKDNDSDEEPAGPPDMYKAFNGQALMALGMLMQEYMASLVQPTITPEWEESVAMEGKARKAGEGGAVTFDREAVREPQQEQGRDNSASDEDEKDDSEADSSGRSEGDSDSSSE